MATKTNPNELAKENRNLRKRISYLEDKVDLILRNSMK